METITYISRMLLGLPHCRFFIFIPLFLTIYYQQYEFLWSVKHQNIYLPARARSLNLFFWIWTLLLIWTSYTFMERMGCNDFKSPTSDTPIQKYNAQNTTSCFSVKKRNTNGNSTGGRSNLPAQQDVGKLVFQQIIRNSCYQTPSFWTCRRVGAISPLAGDMRGSAFMGGGRWRAPGRRRHEKNVIM